MTRTHSWLLRIVNQAELFNEPFWAGLREQGFPLLSVPWGEVQGKRIRLHNDLMGLGRNHGCHFWPVNQREDTCLADVWIRKHDNSETSGSLGGAQRGATANDPFFSNP